MGPHFYPFISSDRLWGLARLRSLSMGFNLMLSHVSISFLVAWYVYLHFTHKNQPFIVDKYTIVPWIRNGNLWNFPGMCVFFSNFCHLQDASSLGWWLVTTLKPWFLVNGLSPTFIGVKCQSIDPKYQQDIPVNHKIVLVLVIGGLGIILSPRRQGLYLVYKWYFSCQLGDYATDPTFYKKLKKPLI